MPMATMQRGMRRVAKYALTYFGTAGVILLLAGGLLLFALVDKYNETRKVDIFHATTTFIVMALGQTMLTAGVVAYVAVRRSYTPPPLPPLPKAETVALIPAYNEEGRVGAVVREAKKYVDLVIVADDGSADNTAKEAEEAGAVVIRHPQNMGKGAAVATLIKAALAADAKYAVLLDADGQHDPTDIPKFLQALKSGADHAAGNRFPHTKMPTIRRLGYKALALLHRILIAKLNDPIQRLPSLQPKSPRNPKPRLRPLIRRRDRNKLPTQKSQNRRNTNHGKVPRSIKQSKPPTPRTQPPLVNTMDRPHKKTCININTRRNLLSYIHHAVHSRPHHIQRNKIRQTNLHNAGNTSRNSCYTTNSNSNIDYEYSSL
jgi:glycosyltransferase involved in cell wall biosynthesis